MYQYRQILVRRRRGDSDRDIARSKTMGRKKIAQVCEIANERGWLAPDSALPDEQVLADFRGRRRSCQPAVFQRWNYGASKLRNGVQQASSAPPFTRG